MHTATGLDHLEMATALLRRVRREHPTAGLWEAADLQWWWRTERTSDWVEQTYWLDDDRPFAGVVFTDWGRVWSCDLIVLPSRAEHLSVMWSHAANATRALSIGRIEVAIDDDETHSIRLAERHGLHPTQDHGIGCWMDAGRRPDISPLPAGYALGDRTARPQEQHHLVRRSGPAVARRLAQTSLYRPDLDLYVEHESGEIAGYGLFWLDPATRVGLVEPMRTEQGHEGRGLARHVLTQGLARLTALGAERLKVNYDAGNERAGGLYLSAGFTPMSSSTMFTGTVG